MKIEEAVPAHVLESAEKVKALIAFFEENPDRLDHAHGHFRSMVGHHPLTMHDGFYTMNLLTRQGADYFLDAADRMADYFNPNDEEGLAYQIPEVVLNHHAGTLEEYLLSGEIAQQVLWPLFHLMYGNAPNYISSLQLARYSYPTNKGTGWHCDTDSEATCVVSLAPERHVGGGTMIMPRGVFSSPIKLHPLPKGHAVLFDGRRTLHRGLELEGGERNLLVYWMKHISL